MRKIPLLLVLSIIIFWGCGPALGVYRVGDTGPAGGLVFYVNPSSGADGWNYLEAAPYGWFNNSDDPYEEWGHSSDTISGADGTEIGTGSQNTADIVAAYGSQTTVASLCADLELGGYDDWFLPSKDEFDLMYENLHVMEIGGFRNLSYWSSSENESGHISFAWRQYFMDGVVSSWEPKTRVHRVRAIRAF